MIDQIKANGNVYSIGMCYHKDIGYMTTRY